MEENCEVCKQEEAKSPSLKINGTKILERVILPSNDCWICNLKFEDSECQINHFAEHHECQLCTKDVLFASLQENKKHLYKEHGWCDLCGQIFERGIFERGGREKHILDDHGLHACNYCEKYFQTESEVVDHTARVHLRCEFCSRQFKSLQEIREHVLKKHFECGGKYFE